MRAGVPFHSRRGILNPTQQAINRILALPGLEAAYFPYIPGLTLPFVGTTNASAWPDMSGKGRPLLQATGANQPLITGGSLLFNGTTQFLSAAFNVAQPYTDFSDLKNLRAVSVSNDTFLGSPDGNTATFFITGGATIGEYATFAAANSGKILLPSSYATVAAVYDGANSLVQLDASVGGTINPGSAGANGIVAGSGTAGTQPSNVGESCILRVSRNVGAAERNQIIADIVTLRLAAGIT